MSSYADLMQMCRLCLVKEQVNLPIFDGPGELQQIFLKITACLPVKVSREDNLPKSICDGCGYKLDLLYQFWNTSSNSEKQLIDWLTAAGVDPKHTANEPIGLASQPTNVILKEEPIGELDAISSDAQSYIIQQQQLAYKPEEFEESQQNAKSTKTKAVSDAGEEPAPKRPRRATRNSKSVREDSDDDYVDTTATDIAKTEDDTEEDDEEDDGDGDEMVDDDMGDPDFVAAEEDTEQPGPSGVSGTKSTSGPGLDGAIDAVARGVDSIDERTLLAERKRKKRPGEEEWLTRARQAVNRQPPPPASVKRELRSNKSIDIDWNALEKNFTRKKSSKPKENDTAADNSKEQTNIEIIAIHCVEDSEFEDVALDLRVETTSEPSNESTEEFVPPEELTVLQNGLPLKCGVCHRRFTDEILYVGHMQRAHKRLKCLLCGRDFKMRVKAYTDHMEKVHRKDGKFTCKVKDCDEKPQSIRGLELHMRRHRGDYLHKCPDCGREYYTDISYRNHRESVHEGVRYTCEVCGSVIRGRRHYKDHVRKHGETNPMTYECDICHKFYSSRTGLVWHRRIHTGQSFVCHLCGHKSTQHNAYTRHLQSHTGAKAFVCDLCGASYACKESFQRHLNKVHKLHMTKKCTHCDQTFPSRYKLLQHMHTHTDIERKLQCSFCDQTFIDINFLRAHVNKVHIEKIEAKVTLPRKKRRRVASSKTFVCCVCNEGFASPELMREHYRIHEEGREQEVAAAATYMCNYCNGLFANMAALNEHLVTHRATELLTQTCL